MNPSAFINMRSLFFGLITLILIGLPASAFAETAKPSDNIPKQEVSAQQGPLGYDEIPMFIVIPRDQGNSTSIISLRGPKPPFSGTVLRDKEDEPVGIIFHHWMGFALRDNESIPMRISVEIIRPVEPMGIIKLLASNATLDEIRNVIRTQEGNVTNRGIMRLGNYTYRLIEIMMQSSANKTVLNARVSKPFCASDQNVAIIGHLTLSLAREGTAQVSQGDLNISDDKYNGNYNVLLDTQDVPPRDHGMGNSEWPMLHPD